MSENKQSKPKRESTDVFSSLHPQWLDTPVPESYEDDNLFKIILFFVIYSPCEAQSRRSRPLSFYKWKDKPWYVPSYLKKPLDKVIFGEDERRFYVGNRKNFASKIAGHDLDEDFYNHRSSQRIGIVNSQSNEYMSLFYHIRNSLAHGRLAMYQAHGEDIMFVMEDGNSVGAEKDDKFEVTARIVLLKSTLLNIIELIKAGPAQEDDYRLDILKLICDGKHTKREITDELRMDDKTWDTTILKLKSSNEVYYEKGKWLIKA